MSGEANGFLDIMTSKDIGQLQKIEGGVRNNSCEELSMEEEEVDSMESLSSLDLVDDASSSSSTQSLQDSTPANGPLYELSSLMTQLPIKRGLSKFYQGKSQSYTSLAQVKSIEDLAKRVNPNAKKFNKIKSSKSYGAFLDSPKATITKKTAKGSNFLSSSLCKRSSSFLALLSGS